MPHLPKVFLSIEKSRGFGRGLLQGIVRYSRLFGPWNFHIEHPFYYGTSNKSKPIRDILKKIHFDGIIMRESPDMDKIIQMRIPMVVSTYMRHDKIPNVVCLAGDSKKVGKLAAEHLLEHGFEHYAYCGIPEKDWSIERGKSFAERLMLEGYSVKMYEFPSKYTWESDAQYLTDWLKKLPKPVGLMTCTDERGQDVVELCKVAGIKVPDEIAVIGVDNDSLLCELVTPPLSSVALDAESAGYQAAQTLNQMMNKKKVNRGTIIYAPATKVVVRQSTDVYAIPDTDVVTALRFIQNHAKQCIQVTDVVNATSIQTRALQKRFYKYLGCSIRERIYKARIDLICRFLAESSLPIAQIAEQLDFISEGHISRYFKKYLQITPLQYRQKHALFG